MDRRVVAAWLALIVVPWVGACGDDGHTLLVDVVTNHVPGPGFNAVRTSLEDLSGAVLRTEVVPAAAGEPYGDGVRVAELDGVAEGEYSVHAQLLSGDALVAERRVSVTVTANTGVTVTINRECGTETCNAVDDDCDGAVDEGDATALCGLEGVAAASCTAGACGIVECTLGRLDCDGGRENGCEIDATADETSCGECGLACGAGLSCDRGLCRAGGAFAADVTWPAEETRTVVSVGDGWVVAESTKLARVALYGLDASLAERWSWSARYVSNGTIDLGGLAPEPDGEIAFILSLRAVDAADATYDLGFATITVPRARRTTLLVRFGPDGSHLSHRSISLIDPQDLVAVVASGADGWVIRSDHRLPVSFASATPYVFSERADGTTRWRRTFDEGAPTRPRPVDLRLTRAGPGGDVLVAASDFADGSVDLGDGATPVSPDTAVLAAYDLDGNLLWKQVHIGTVLATAVGSDGAATFVIVPLGSTTTTIETRDRNGALVRSFELPLDRLDDLAGIAVGERGDVYVAGTVVEAVDFGGGPRGPFVAAMALAAFAPDGGYRFDRVFAVPGTSRGSGVAVGPGQVLVYGAFDGSVDFGGGARTGDGTAVGVLFDD